LFVKRSPKGLQATTKALPFEEKTVQTSHEKAVAKI
jgi:hypothetical protein